MNTIDHLQGTDAWHAHRSSHFNASDAPAMMGLSPYKTRSELLREMATGITPEIDPATQRRFDDGHRFEALARPVAEKILGESLFPVVGYEGKLSASFDGLTMDGMTCWEHKTINDAYRNAIANETTLPAALLVQIEQQLMISGAENCLFTATRWDGETCIEAIDCFVESDPELRKALLQGWTQFAIDLEAYQHVEQTVAPVAAPIEALPALAVTVTGSISLTHNLERFGQRLTAFVGGLNAKPETDQDFADLDAAVKVLKEAEAALDSAEKNALAQTTTIADMCSLVEMYRKVARDNRLMFEKIVKQEKDNRRADIIRGVQIELTDHIRKLNERIGGQWMPVANFAPFAEAIKGLKKLDAMRDKVSTALANAKIEANEIADRIEANAKAITVDGANYNYLVHDFAQVCTKAPEDFAAMMAVRIATHKEAEAAKIAAAVEAERKAGEARAAAAIEDERMAEVKRVAEQAANDQRGKPPVSESEGAINQAQDQLAERQSTPPITADESLINAFVSLLSISPLEKKQLRLHLQAYEKYRIAHEMQAAA